MDRKKTHKNIGQLEGKILVFGGVYSNLQALQTMQSIAKAEGIAPDRIICTGDVVGYCAQPEEVVTAVREWGIHTIAGNVEIQLREGQDHCGCDFDAGSRCDVFSTQWYPYAQKSLSPASLEWMQTLPDFIDFRLGNKRGIVVHGSYHETSGYVFKSSPWPTKQQNFDATQTDLILAGHCGLPFSEEQNNKLWLNPGVIGMPANDATPRVWYMLLEADQTGEVRYSHRAFEYDHGIAADLMLANHLPEQYALTLSTGVWDNCEILPDCETKMQGVPLGEVPFEVFTEACEL